MHQSDMHQSYLAMLMYICPYCYAVMFNPINLHVTVYQNSKLLSSEMTEKVEKASEQAALEYLKRFRWADTFPFHRQNNRQDMTVDGLYCSVDSTLFETACTNCSAVPLWLQEGTELSHYPNMEAYPMRLRTFLHFGSAIMDEIEAETSHALAEIRSRFHAAFEDSESRADSLESFYDELRAWEKSLDAVSDIPCDDLLALAEMLLHNNEEQMQCNGVKRLLLPGLKKKNQLLKARFESLHKTCTTQFEQIQVQVDHHSARMRYIGCCAFGPSEGSVSKLGERGTNAVFIPPAQYPEDITTKITEKMKQFEAKIDTIQNIFRDIHF